LTPELAGTTKSVDKSVDAADRSVCATALRQILQTDGTLPPNGRIGAAQIQQLQLYVIAPNHDSRMIELTQ